MSATCSPGREIAQEAYTASPEGRDGLVRAAVMLRESRAREAGEVLADLPDSVLVKDWRVQTVREILKGQPSPDEMREASNLLTQTMRQVK